MTLDSKHLLFLNWSMSIKNKIASQTKEKALMKNIFEILKEYGLEVQEDKKKDFEKLVQENYKTSADYDKRKGSLDKANETIHYSGAHCMAKTIAQDYRKRVLRKNEKYALSKRNTPSHAVITLVGELIQVIEERNHFSLSFSQGHSIFKLKTIGLKFAKAKMLKKYKL